MFSLLGRILRWSLNFWGFVGCMRRRLRVGTALGEGHWPKRLTKCELRRMQPLISDTARENTSRWRENKDGGCGDQLEFSRLPKKLTRLLSRSFNPNLPNGSWDKQGHKQYCLPSPVSGTQSLLRLQQANWRWRRQSMIKKQVQMI